MMLLFNTWQELNICLNTELGLKLIQRYQFITISYDRQFLNLFWYKKPLNWIMNLYNNLNGNKLELVCLLCSSFFCLIYCLHYILTILLMVINKVTQLNNPRRND
jgi:GT2 family glycosyltransferase